MATESDNLVLERLRGISAELAPSRVLPERLAELRSEMTGFRADVASDFVTVYAEIQSTRDRIVGLRRAVIDYHSGVVGHGILISELEGRARRVERHLDLPPLDPR